MGLSTELRTGAAAAVLVFGMVAGTVAEAATVTITAPKEVGDGDKSVELSCTGTCEFWYLDLEPSAGFSSSDGSWLNIGTDNSNTTRLDFVNLTTGNSFEGQSESSDGSLGVGIPGFTEGNTGSWTGSALYYLAWGGPQPRHILIKNLTANNTFTWTNIDAAGLSGVDGFGVIPLPAAGWLLLGGLGALGFVGHRRRKQAA